MQLSEIYTGIPVRILGYEGIWEIIKIENITKSVWVNKINSTNHDMREFAIDQLQRL